MRIKQLITLSVLSFLLVIIGCGGGGDSAPAPESTTSDSPAATPAPSAPAGNSNITGTIKFNGTAPERTPIRQDRECAELHDAAVLSESVVVNENATVKYVFVYVKQGLEGQTFPVPSQPVVFDQTGCMYQPHIFGVQVGQTIKIKNSDPLLHNIHALPEANRPFNFGMPNQGDERDRDFRTAEVMVKIKCDVHPWMSAYAGVLPHPYYSVTGDDGSFSLEGLPAGDYVIEAWHETFGTATQNVTVGDGQTQSIEFTFGEGA